MSTTIKQLMIFAFALSCCLFSLSLSISPRFLASVYNLKQASIGLINRTLQGSIYEIVPKMYDPDFKAPCWYNDKKQLTCLPYFYIAGFPKSGTTDLWFKILKHPHVVKVCKEPHWWAWRQYGVSLLPTCKAEARRVKTKNGDLYNDSSIKWYLEFYRLQGATDIISRNNDSNSFHPMVFGDASISTSYGTTAEFFRKYELQNERYDKTRSYYVYYNNSLDKTIPELLHSITPGAKIIMILRDPVDRYYSGYQYSPFGRIHGSPADFHRQTVNAIRCFNKCVNSHTVYYCAHHVEYCKNHSHGFLDKLPLGMYSVFIKDWLDAFPRKQLHFMTLNELKINPESSITDIFRFLELPLFAVTTNKKPANSKIYKEMFPQTRKMLQKFYRPFDVKLLTLLKDVKFTFSSLNISKNTFDIT